MNPLIKIFFRGGEKNDRSRSTERGCPFKANLSFRARSPLRDRLLNEAISRPIGWVTRYQASSRGFFPLAAVTIFAEHLNGILHRLSLSLSRCSRRQPIPRAYDRKVCAIITVVIARAYTTALNAASGGSGVENTEYNRWTNCRGNRRVNALFPRYRYISLLVFIIPRLL